MRILFFSDNFPPETNAIASRVFERARWWVKWGHNVTVVTSAPNFPEGKVYPGYRNRWYQTEMLEGIRVVRMKTFMAPNEGFLLRTLDFLSYLPGACIVGICERRPDVVVATSPQFFTAVTGWLVSVIRRLPFVFEVADLWPASIVAVGAMEKSWMLRRMEDLELFLYRKADAIVALTAAFKEDMVRRGTVREKIYVVINGVELAQFAPRARDEVLAAELGLQQAFVVGYLGTHGVAHGLDHVLDTAALLSRDRDVTFLFVGAGAQREKLVAQASGMGLENVRFCPPQSKMRMPSFWSICDVALIHLKNDPVFSTVIPSKMFEAMAMGLPLLVVAPRGEASNIVEKEGIGLWVSAGDANAFAYAVRRLKADLALRTRYQSTSREVAPQYSRERQARDMQDVFMRVLVARG